MSFRVNESSPNNYAPVIDSAPSFACSNLGVVVYRSLTAKKH